MTDIKTKDGVKIDNLNKEIKGAIPIIAKVYDKYGFELAITSGHEGFKGDGVHMESSKHYYFDAIDLRIWGIREAGCMDIICTTLRFELGEGFDVVEEDDHIHIEKR